MDNWREEGKKPCSWTNFFLISNRYFLHPCDLEEVAKCFSWPSTEIPWWTGNRRALGTYLHGVISNLKKNITHVDLCQSRGRIRRLGWTYRFPLFLSLHPSQYSPSFNVAAWLRRREKGGRNFQEIPRMLHCLWTKMDHVPFRVRDRNKYCVLLWLSCVMVDSEFCFVLGFFNFFLYPLTL